MNAVNKKLVVATMIVILISISGMLFLPKEEKRELHSMSLRIGAGDDSTGLLILRIMDNMDHGIRTTVEDYEFQDC